MALQQTHVGFINEVSLENPLLFEDLDNNSLYYGAVYPDLFYVSFFNFNQNLSLFLHNHRDIINIGKELFLNARNNKEKSFALDFISHFFLDKRIHGYLEKIGSLESSSHLALKFHLHTILKHRGKVSVSRTPIKLLKKVFSKYIFHSKIKHHSLRPTKLNLKIFLFACNYIQKETIDICYTRVKRSNFFKNMLLKLSYYFAFRSYGYSVYKLFHPNYVFLNKHSLNLLKEYNLAKKDFIKYLNKNIDVYG